MGKSLEQRFSEEGTPDEEVLDYIGTFGRYQACRHFGCGIEALDRWLLSRNVPHNFGLTGKANLLPGDSVRDKTVRLLVKIILEMHDRHKADTEEIRRLRERCHILDMQDEDAENYLLQTILRLNEGWQVSRGEPI